jgi:hypothetical protein
LYENIVLVDSFTEKNNRTIHDIGFSSEKTNERYESVTLFSTIDIAKGSFTVCRYFVRVPNNNPKSDMDLPKSQGISRCFTTF